MSPLGEGGESETVERDDVVEPRTNLSQTVETFRNELNDCLARHDYAMAAQFQRCFMAILNALNGTIPMTNEVRADLFNMLGDSLESMADQIRNQMPNVAERYNAYGGQLREMTH